MEEEAEVETLLQQVAQAKHKELRLRAEKKRIRDEIGQLQAGALYSREEQTQKQLAEVRRAREQLEAQRKTEEEKLVKLSESLKEQELKFRKNANAKSSPFQQVAASVVAPVSSAAAKSDTLKQDEDESVPTRAKNDASPYLGGRHSPLARTASPGRYEGSTGPIGNGNQETGTRDYDTLQRLVGSINCEEQQKRIERLQAELLKASSRRQEEDSGFLLMKVPTRMLSDNLARLDGYPEDDYLRGNRSRSPTLLQRAANPTPLSTKQLASARKAANKFIHLTPLGNAHPDDQLDAIPTSGYPTQPQVDSAPAVPPMQSTAIPTVPNSSYPAPFAVPSYPQSYLVPMSPYPLFSSPGVLPGHVNPYGVGYPQPYFPGCSYPTAIPPWLPQSASYPTPVNYFSSMVPVEHPPKAVLHEQEEEVRRLERELEMQRITAEQKAEAKELSRLQDRLLGLQTKISTLTVTDNSDAVPINDGTAEYPADVALKTLKRQHLASLAKVHNERDLLEEQEKLEDLKERIQRRKEEKKRELDHEDWIAQQKRELVALRLQRVIQHSEEAKPTELPSELLGESTEPYNSDSGFVLFWDYAAGVPAAANDLQITYAVYQGKVIRTPFKIVAAKETRIISPEHKMCLFVSFRHFKRLSASRDVRVILEVASVSQNTAGSPHTPTSLGWAAFNIFKTTDEGEVALASGFFKLPVKQSLMPDPSKSFVSPPPTDTCGDMRIHIRLARGESASEASRMLVDPELHAARYQLPDTGKSASRPQSKGMMAQRPSLQGRGTPNGKPAAAKPLDERKRTPSPGLVEQIFDTPPSVRPQKQDFLDVERLRLLSSASSRPQSTRPRSNLPSTGSDKPRLSAFREDSDAEKDEPWIRVDKSLELQRRLLGGNLFQPGDGFNVFVDGGRGFPDNVTTSKVTIAALHADRTQVLAENGSAFASTTSNAFDPNFDAYVEYRQSSFNPTLTLVIRVDTIELVSKQPVIMGYSVFPVFLDPETRDQPVRPSILQFVLHEGGFQLPIHSQMQSADVNQQVNAKSCEDFPRIPCATILLRITRAKVSGDGLALLSRKDFPSQEWEAKGLLAPAPHYADQFYDSLRSTPSGIEEKIYADRHMNRKPKPIAQCLQQISLSGSEARDTLKAKPPNYLDLRSALRYDPAIGFRIAVDALYNVKAKGSPFFKVLFSVYPPGSFYQPVRLTGDVFFTTTMSWTSSQASPEFSDGYLTLRDSPSDTLLVVLFDIRSITRHPKTGAITLQKYGWTFLPVLANSRYVDVCSIQLPVFQGEVNLSILKGATGGLGALVDEIGNDKVKSLVPVSEEGASLFVRLHDPQLPHLSTEPISSARLSKMIPQRTSAKYTYDGVKLAALKKKSPLSKLLPANVPEAQFEKELNQAFASEMGIHHLLF